MAGEDVEDLQERLDAQRDEFVDLLEDVRSRVIQVKRETDAKAPADHEHEGYASTKAIAELGTELEDLGATVDAGFRNFESVLDHVLSRVEDLEDRSTLLASAVVDLRDRRNAIVEREQRRAEAERLKLAANRLGVRTAACDDCGSDVDLALLTRAECPHCDASIADVHARSSIFGSHALETGDPPALTGRVEPPVGTTDDEVFDAVATDADRSTSDATDSGDEAAERTARADGFGETGVQSADNGDGVVQGR